jgi:hypothetical protein
VKKQNEFFVYSSKKQITFIVAYIGYQEKNVVVVVSFLIRSELFQSGNIILKELNDLVHLRERLLVMLNSIPIMRRLKKISEEKKIK